MNEVKKNIETVSLIVSVALIVISIVIGVTYYNVNDRKLMSANIDSAIAKGIDPISVRCSFAQSGDTICVAHAASMGSSGRK
jgi:ABC-type molybdate transport system substrate-binding protein